MRKTVFAAVAAAALGAGSAVSTTAMAAHGGGGGGHMGGGGGHMGGGFGHMGGGFGGHIGGFGAAHFGAAHFGGFSRGFAPHFAGVAPGGVVGVAPHTFAGFHGNPHMWRGYAFRGDRDRDRDRNHFRHRRIFFGFDNGLYAYDGSSCYYGWPYTTWPYNSCYRGYDQNYQ
jgi:hypothetical protein